MGILYIVSTPIGNLKDISIRAVEILNAVEFIACEDTRKTGFLLNSIAPLYNRLTHYTSETKGLETVWEIQNSQRIEKPILLSYYEQNEFKRIPQIITALKNGADVALVSDAGTPTISDPGFKLVRQCIQEGIQVVSIPGPSAAISALVVSGLPTDKFLFIGYLPKKQGHRKKLLEQILSSQQHIASTVILFEAPHRIKQAFEELKGVFGDIHMVVAREITKVHEEIRREKISSLQEHFKTTIPKGEFVLLFHI